MHESTMMVHWLFSLLAASCVLADAVEDRKTKLPFIADAVGNQIPAPSNGPAPVGSPSNLLTPDRYEFYTFDESGELVKRLMTLEEIQAIVAAGEGTEGHLVTFANDDQPNISFNFSQAPFTKVHNVVTNVQNVLKAQMEAQKINPPIHTTLDTPDVSDSWSLILPTIFGNTGAEIIPDKSSNTHTIPETDTLELDFDENSLSKEGDSHFPNSSVATSKYEESEITTENKKEEATTVFESLTTISEATAIITTSTTTPRPSTTSTTTTTPKPSSTSTTTTTVKPQTTTTTTTTTARPRITSTSTARPRTTIITTSKPRSTTTTTTTPKSTTTRKFSTTTLAPKKIPTSTTTTTAKPRVTSTTKRTDSSTTLSPKPTTEKLTTIPFNKSATPEYSRIPTINHLSTEKITTQGKITSYVPISTVAYVTTERSTVKTTEFPKTTASYSSTTKRSVSTANDTTTTITSSLSTKVQPAITTYKPTKVTTSTTNLYVTKPSQENIEIIDNVTTITTQSMSPSTTVSTLDFMMIDNNSKPVETIVENNNHQNEYQVPYFDIAQSISQIASELDNEPIPTTTSLPDPTKSSEFDLESKENVDMDINDIKNNTETKLTTIPLHFSSDNEDKYVKISTLDPPVENKKENKPDTENSITIQKNETDDKLLLETQTILQSGTTMDPILFESLDDLFSQIINQNPQIVQDTEKPGKDDLAPKTTTESIKNIHTTSSMPVTKAPLSSAKNESDKSVTEKPSDLIGTIKLSVDTESPTPTVAGLVASSTDGKIKIELNLKDELVKNTTKNVVNPLSTTMQTILPTTQASANNENISHDKNNETNKNTTISDSIPSIDTMNENIKPTQSSTEKYVTMEDNLYKKKNSSSITVINKEEQKHKNNNIGAEQNKLQNVQEIHKGPDLKPKIDEFKKKIQKVNIDDKELMNDRNSSWKLISTVKPPKGNEVLKDKINYENTNYVTEQDDNKDINLEVSKENQGLAVTAKDLSEDVAQFTELCNELAFRYWHSMTENIEKKRSFVLSPYSITSMLAMMFMGARGGTSGEMNEILKLDDMVTFNPHFTLKNISDSIETTPEAGVTVSAFIRELYSDRNRGKILTFYKERAQHFYNGHVEEINFKLISDIIRRRTNLLVKRYTWGRIPEYMKANSITMQPPLAALSTNIFETDCSGTSVEGRDGEMYFVVSPTVRQRRLVPVPAVVYKKGFLAGYDPVLDATAAALGNTNSIVSTLFLMPGQQGNVVHADDLEALERRLLDSNPTTDVWNRLLRTLLPRMGLDLQIPRFSHKSIFNVSSTLKNMGLKELFDSNNADLGGLNGPSKDLYLSDMIQLTTFVTCGEGVIGEQHHIEEYPERMETLRKRRTSRWAASWDEPRDYQRAFHDPHDVGDAMHLPLHLRPRQARLPSRNAQPARLKFDRPFLFFVRHNPSGMILYVGRYNPRLLP